MGRLRIDMRGLCRPNPGGQAFFARDWHHPFVALEGGWGAGKTWIGARKLLTLHLANAFDDRGRPTCIPHAVVAPSYRNARDVNVPELLSACAEIGLSCNWRSANSELELPDLGTADRPSLILVRTAERPERITGWEVGGAWGDEAARWRVDRGNPTGDAYLQLTGRVRHPRARLRQMMLTYTNEGDGTRVYEEFHAGREDHALYRAGTDENPAVRAFYDLQRRLMSEEMRKQYLEGQALSLGGQRVYLFDPHLHVDAAVSLAGHLPVQVAVDFNIRPGMHAEIGQYCPASDCFTVVHEIYQVGLDVRGLTGQLVALLRQAGRMDGGAVVEVFGDATGNSRWAGTGESCYQILQMGLAAGGVDFRMRVPRANPPVVDRVNAMNVAMMGLDGGVNWRCHPRCQQLIEDLRRSMRDAQGGFQQRDPMRGHASDAEGYRVWYLRPVRVGGRAGPAGRFSV